MSELVLVHGFLGSPSSWDEVRARLRRAHAIRTLTLLGHDRGPHEAQRAARATSFELEIARLLAEIGPTSETTLVGYSLGARVALGLAARSAAPFPRLVLISGRDGLDDEDEARARRMHDDALADTLERGGLEAFVDRWQALPLFASQASLDEARRARHRARRLDHDAEGVAAALRVLSLGRMPLFASQAFTRTPRVDLVAGGEDEKFRVLARALVEAHRAPTTHTTLHVVPDAGHDVVLERPDVVADLLEERT